MLIVGVIIFMVKLIIILLVVLSPVLHDQKKLI